MAYCHLERVRKYLTNCLLHQHIPFFMSFVEPCFGQVPPSDRSGYSTVDLSKNQFVFVFNRDTSAGLFGWSVRVKMHAVQVLFDTV